MSTIGKGELYGKNAVVVGDILYGCFYGVGTSRHPAFETIEVKKVGRQYIYDSFGKKLEIAFDKRYYPQYDTLIAVDVDPNHRYEYFRTEDGAKKRYKANRLRIQLSAYSFRNQTDDEILKIAQIVAFD